MNTEIQHPIAQYILQFEGGGWNSVYARSRSQAIKFAADEYKDSSLLNPIESSFFLKSENEEAYESLMSLFY